MTLVQNIIDSKPREESGSKTSRKYTFQNDFSLYLLLRRHESLIDYVYLFDYHEDLVVVDSADNPDKIDFYQIKSKDKGHWTVNELIKSEIKAKDKKPKLSILGKLYQNKLNFPQNTRSLIFVSNAPFSFKDSNGKPSKTNRTLIKALELDAKEIQACTLKLNQEHELADAGNFVPITEFKVTKLSNSDSSTHCVGELTRLTNALNPEHKINCQLAYNQIIGEVRRKTNAVVSSQPLTDFQELVAIKGISKKQFIDYLEKAGLYKSVEDDWNELKNELVANGITAPIELSKYRKGYRDVSMSLIRDVNKIPLKNLQKEINSALLAAEATSQITDKSTLKEIIDYVTNKIQINLYDIYFVKCLIIKSIYEKYQ